MGETGLSKIRGLSPHILPLSDLPAVHSARCIHAVVCEVHGKALSNLEKSNIFDWSTHVCAIYMPCMYPFTHVWMSKGGGTSASVEFSENL